LAINKKYPRKKKTPKEWSGETRFGTRETPQRSYSTGWGLDNESGRVFGGDQGGLREKKRLRDRVSRRRGRIRKSGKRKRHYSLGPSNNLSTEGGGVGSLAKKRKERKIRAPVEK